MSITALPDVETEMETAEVVDIVEFLAPYEETNDPNLRAHIINPPSNLHIWEPGMSTKDVLHIARVQQLEVVALCGHRFVPKHDPEKFAACKPCIDIAGEIMAGAGE